MKQDKTIICSYIGGSHSYGLNTTSSDLDKRGVYLVNSLDHIINPQSYIYSNCAVTTTDPSKGGEDSCYYELRHFIYLLKKGNTLGIEAVFNTKFITIDPLFRLVLAQRQYLLDPEAIYKSISSYSDAEYKLAQGLRTGKLGSKRQTQIVKYGFSPKNWVNLLRILYCGEQFFACGEYPVDMTGTYIHPQLMEIKLNPERFTADRLAEMYKERKTLFENSWTINKDKICKQYKYDPAINAQVAFDCYKNLLFQLGHISLFERAYSLIMQTFY
jgi:hypothetical protein